MKNSAFSETDSFSKIMIDVATRCNLNCPVCYWVNNRPEELPFKALEGFARECRGKIISLSGGEPTLREDLPKIISLFSRRNTVFLITNGLRLTDYAYLKSLQNSGLRYISFSFNGFSDSVYTKINGQPLLDLKLRALENIKKAGIKTILSVLIVKGLNEDQLGAILHYCLANQDFIRELRIRSMAPISKYLSAGRYSVLELLAVICRECLINQDEILKEQMLKQGINHLLSGSLFTQKNCSFDFHLKKKQHAYLPVGSKLDANAVGQARAKGIFLLSALCRAYGLPMLAAGFLKAIFRNEKKPWIHGRNIFKIGLRSWPTEWENNLSEEIDCQTGYYVEGRILPFCYAIVAKGKEKA